MTALAQNIDKLNGFPRPLARNRHPEPHCRSTTVTDPAARFQTRSRLSTNRLICDVARGNAADIDAAANAAADGLPRLARHGRHRTATRSCSPSPMPSKSPRRRDCALRMLGHRSDPALHVQGRPARRRKLPLFRRSGGAGPRWPAPEIADPDEHHHPRSHRPGRGHHALEYPFMLSTWKIAPALAAGCTVVHKPAEDSPLISPPSGRNRRRGRPAPGCAQHRQRLWPRCRQAPDRTPPDPRHCLCRRKPHRLDHHQTGRRYAQAHASRTWRQEPGHRVRRRRSRPGARCGDLHDLLDQR